LGRDTAVCDWFIQSEASYTGYETETYTAIPYTNGRVPRGKHTTGL